MDSRDWFHSRSIITSSRKCRSVESGFLSIKVLYSFNFTFWTEKFCSIHTLNRSTRPMSLSILSYKRQFMTLQKVSYFHEFLIPYGLVARVTGFHTAGSGSIPSMGNNSNTKLFGRTKESCTHLKWISIWWYRPGIELAPKARVIPQDRNELQKPTKLQWMYFLWVRKESRC